MMFYKINNRLVFLLMIFFSQFSNQIKADSIQYASVGFQSHYGFIIPHSKAIENVSNTNPFGFGLCHNKLHTSFNEWQVFNAYWFSGIEAGYFNFQNPGVLGSVFDISVYVEPIIRHRYKVLYTIRGGIGVSYHTKIYNPIENPLNHFFSSKVSFPLFVDARFKYRIGNQTFLTLSGCYNHISNGGIKQPNKGMNFPTIAFGIEYFNKSFPALNNDFIPVSITQKPDIFLTMQLISSIKVMNESADYPEKAFFIHGLHTRISKRLGSIYCLNAGGEIIFDGYIKEFLRREQKDLDYKRIALTFGQDFLLGKVIFTQYLGFYIYSPYKARNPVYQKYELAYALNKKILIGFYLKSHMQVAELMGLNINYQWLQVDRKQTR